MAIKLQRVYDEIEGGRDEFRVLVDRLWPRGIKKDQVRIDLWLRDIAPSNELRDWFGHDPAKWDEFRRRYGDELKDKASVLRKLKQAAGHKTLVLLYGAKDREHNQAVALMEILERRPRASRRAA